MTTTSMIRPGLLVALHTRITGGVRYERQDLEAEPCVTKWETTRFMDDPAEHARAVKVRGKAQSIIRRVCSTTSFGILCPMDKEETLDKSVAEAREMIDAFNESANYTHLTLSLLKGRIAETDAEAVRAIVGEIADLIGRIESGIETADVAQIRDAANRARAASAMLDDSTKGKVDEAITDARKAARAIVKRVEKAGEKAADVIATLDTSAITSTRMAFLEMEAAAQTDAAPTPAIDKQRFAELDVDAAETVDTFEPYEFAHITEL